MEASNNAVCRTKVELTLSNVVVPAEKLALGGSPSAQDGLSPEAEYDLRIIGCEYIQSCGILLKLPQTAMATGQVLFHRFYYSKSFVRYNVEHLAMASINLASKIEESPRRIRDVINVFSHIKQIRAGRTVRPVILDANYVETKNQVIKAERRILKELGFCVYVKHPNKIIILYLRVLMMERNRALSQMAWNYMNDSLWTDVFLRYTPESIACACIMLAARKLNIPLPRNPPWYLLFGVKMEDIEAIGVAILRLYSHKTKPYSEYERLLAELKEKQDRERRANREKPAEPPTNDDMGAAAAESNASTEKRAVAAAEIDDDGHRPRSSKPSHSSNGERRQSRKRPLPFAPSSSVVVVRKDDSSRNRKARRRSSSQRHYSSVSSSASTSPTRNSHHHHRRPHRHHHRHRRHHRHHEHRARRRREHSRQEHRRSRRQEKCRTLSSASAESDDQGSSSSSPMSDDASYSECSSRKGDPPGFEEISSGEERFLRMQLIKQAVRTMDERVGNEVLRAERIRRFGMAEEEQRRARNKHYYVRRHDRRSASPDDSRRRYAPGSSSSSGSITSRPTLVPSTLAHNNHRHRRNNNATYKSRSAAKCLQRQR